MIKAISFDLWSTLIRSNKTGIKKYNYFHSYYNPLNKTLDEVKSIFNKVKSQSDRISEISGLTLLPEQIATNILLELGNSIQVIHSNLKDIMDYFENHTLKPENLPVLYDENTRSVLQWLYDNDFKMCISCNTGLLSGTVMKKVLDKLDISKYFIGFNFSDEIGFSKPHQIFYLAVKDVLNTVDFLHVGDNIFADGKAGNPFIINSNNKSILDLQNHITNNLLQLV